MLRCGEAEYKCCVVVAVVSSLKSRLTCLVQGMCTLNCQCLRVLADSVPFSSAVGPLV